MAGQNEELVRRVYAYFIWRLRQPGDAERLTQLSFERVWQESQLNREAEREPDLPVFAAARRVIAENPRPQGITKVNAPTARPTGEDGRQVGLSHDLGVAMGRLHGREREALALRFGAELSIGEIAELLDRTPADVKQRLARGVRGLLDLGVLPKRASQKQGRGSAPKRSGARRPEKGEAEKRDAGGQSDRNA